MYAYLTFPYFADTLIYSERCILFLWHLHTSPYDFYTSQELYLAAADRLKNYLLRKDKKTHSVVKKKKINIKSRRSKRQCYFTYIVFTCEILIKDKIMYICIYMVDIETILMYNLNLVL